MLAADKCYQLAAALQSMATHVPYEDVLTAATHIGQCAANVLTVSRRGISLFPSHSNDS